MKTTMGLGTNARPGSDNFIVLSLSFFTVAHLSLYLLNSLISGLPPFLRLLQTVVYTLDNPQLTAPASTNHKQTTQPSPPPLNLSIHKNIMGCTPSKPSRNYPYERDYEERRRRAIDAAYAQRGHRDRGRVHRTPNMVSAPRYQTYATMRGGYDTYARSYY